MIDKEEIERLKQLTADNRIAALVDAAKMVLFDQNVPPNARGAALEVMRKLQ